MPSRAAVSLTFSLSRCTVPSHDLVVAVAGSAIKWLRDTMGLIKSAAEVNTLAEAVEDTGGVYFVTAFSGLLAPYWDPDAAGLIIGNRL